MEKKMSARSPKHGPRFPNQSIQSVGQIIGDVLKQLDDDRFIVKASSGPRYVVGCRNKLDKAALKPGTRVSLDMTTLTIMRKLPREVRGCGCGCGCGCMGVWGSVRGGSAALVEGERGWWRNGVHYCCCCADGGDFC